MNQRRTTRRSRRGAVSVEFAFVAPIFVVILMGITQASNLLATKNTMSMAAREGARIAAMDHNANAVSGTTTNAKVEADIRNFLQAANLPYEEEDVTVEIVDADDSDKAFDLDDPSNNYKLFEIRIEIPYEDVSGYTPPGFEESNLGAQVVFRNSKSPAPALVE